MKKFKYTKPLRINEASLDDIFDDDDMSNWQLKAERLLRRRERRMRNQMMQY